MAERLRGILSGSDSNPPNYTLNPRFSLYGCLRGIQGEPGPASLWEQGYSLADPDTSLSFHPDQSDTFPYVAALNQNGPFVYDLDSCVVSIGQGYCCDKRQPIQFEITDPGHSGEPADYWDTRLSFELG